MDYGYEYEDRDLWCLFKQDKHISFTLAKINYFSDDLVRVTEYWVGEYSHCIPSNNIYITSPDRSELVEKLEIYNQFISYQQKRFKAVMCLI